MQHLGHHSFGGFYVDAGLRPDAGQRLGRECQTGLP
jgi:hypothetical protein